MYKLQLDLKGHKFSALPFELKNSGGFLASDLICDNCGIICSKYYRIIRTDMNYHKFAQNVYYGYIYTDQLTCEERIIKKFLE